MSFVDAIKSVFTQYVGFSGRARRSEYWFFCLFNIIVSCVLSALASKISILSLLSVVWSLAIFLPVLQSAFVAFMISEKADGGICLHLFR